MIAKPRRGGNCPWAGGKKFIENSRWDGKKFREKIPARTVGEFQREYQRTVVNTSPLIKD